MPIGSALSGFAADTTSSFAALVHQSELTRTTLLPATMDWLTFVASERPATFAGALCRRC